MKSPEQVVRDVIKRLDRYWSASLAREAADDAAGEPGRRNADAGPTEQPVAWPHAFPLGKMATVEAERDFPALVAAVAAWRRWADEHGLELRWENRRILGTSQLLPTHLVVEMLDAAAELAGPPWPERIARGRGRARILAGRYPHTVAHPNAAHAIAPSELGDAESLDPEADDAASTGGSRLDLIRLLRAADELSDVDFDLLCRAGDWFRAHDARGLTPRQVPVEGLHAKWLNTRRHLIRALANVDDLGLVVSHPPRIHFTYLDPDHRASGARLHDSATVGDTAAPAYRPRLVIISENKDTALYFPELPEAISVEGVGRGGSTIASFDWITSAETIIYWGDMDADGLEILNQFRAAGVPATSILMDLASYERWERFGTNHDAQGRPLLPRRTKPLPKLTAGELELYQCLVSAAWDRYRRIEQERIPLGAARSRVLRILGPWWTHG